MYEYLIKKYCKTCAQQYLKTWTRGRMIKEDNEMRGIKKQNKTS